MANEAQDGRVRPSRRWRRDTASEDSTCSTAADRRMSHDSGKAAPGSAVPPHRLVNSGEVSMRRHFRFALFAALAAAGSFAAPAQIPAQDRSDDSEIVVEGVRERQQQIRRFVDALTEAPVRGQIGRFDWAVCPAAAGLPDADAADVHAAMDSAGAHRLPRQRDRHRHARQAGDAALASPRASGLFQERPRRTDPDRRSGCAGDRLAGRGAADPGRRGCRSP